MKLEWHDMASAPRKGPVLLLLGETIPEMPDIRVGSYIDCAEANELWGPDRNLREGGWLIWNSGNDWFVVGLNDPMAWCAAELPGIRKGRLSTTPVPSVSKASSPKQAGLGTTSVRLTEKFRRILDADGRTGVDALLAELVDAALSEVSS